MNEDDKIISLQDRQARAQAPKPAKPVDLDSTKIRDLAVKAVIYPQTISASEAQEMGAAILYHLKLYYPANGG